METYTYHKALYKWKMAFDDGVGRKKFFLTFFGSLAGSENSTDKDRKAYIFI